VPKGEELLGIRLDGIQIHWRVLGSKNENGEKKSVLSY